MTLQDISQSLALKLGDPVQDNGDGKLFTFEFRKDYIERAIARLKRILPKLMLNEVPLFANEKRYAIKNLTTNEEQSGKGISLDETYLDIENLYVKLNDDSIIQANRLSSKNYLGVKNKTNLEYIPSIENKQVYYTFLNKKIYLLPEGNKVYTALEIIYTPDSEALNTDPDTEIDIPREYADLLITAAAIEGMMDVGRQDKVQLYTSDLTNQLNVLTQYSTYKEQKKGSEING